MSEYKRLTTKYETGISLIETSGNLVNDYEKAEKKLEELKGSIKC